ncbi:HK97 family phage prohead protease [Bacillus sp. MN7755]
MKGKKRSQSVEQDIVADDYEKRTFSLKVKNVQIQKRDNQGQQSEVLTGYAAVFDQFTELTDWWGDVFYEKLTQDSMNNTLADGHKIFALFNHSWRDLLGSTGDNLTLEIREDGLYFELVPKNFEFDRRVVEMTRSGTIGGCSIGFSIFDQEWEERDGEWFRIIKEISLYEITFTPIPAYPQTSIQVDLRKVESGEFEERSAANQVPKPKEPTQTISDEERQSLLSDVNTTLKDFEKYKK